MQAGGVLMKVELINVIFLNICEGRNYNIEVYQVILRICHTFALNVPSGKVYIGAGEDTRGVVFLPDDSDYISRAFLDLNSEYYDINCEEESDVIKMYF